LNGDFADIVADPPGQFGGIAALTAEVAVYGNGDSTAKDFLSEKSRRVFAFVLSPVPNAARSD
jgi:hypothetical protein